MSTQQQNTIEDAHTREAMAAEARMLAAGPVTQAALDELDHAAAMPPTRISHARGRQGNGRFTSMSTSSGGGSRLRPARTHTPDPFAATPGMRGCPHCLQPSPIGPGPCPHCGR